MLLAHVSNFRPVKRPVDCVEIFARVLKKGIKARLVMVVTVANAQTLSIGLDVSGSMTSVHLSENNRSIVDYFRCLTFCCSFRTRIVWSGGVGSDGL